MLDVKKLHEVDVKDHESYLTDEGLQEFGYLVSQARVRLNLNQHRLGELTGFNGTKVSNIEKGVFKGMTHTDARKIAHILKLTIDDLLREYKSPVTRRWGLANQMVQPARRSSPNKPSFTITEEKRVRINSENHVLVATGSDDDWNICIEKEGHAIYKLWGNLTDDRSLVPALIKALQTVSQNKGK